MSKTSCIECHGTGRLPATIVDGEIDGCPWCDSTGEEEVVYMIAGHGHNGDHAFTECWDVKNTLAEARTVALDAMKRRGENALADGTPTLRWMEITGPGIEESIGLEERDGELVWEGESDDRVEWRIRKNEGEAVARMLEPLPEGAEFKLGWEAGRAYRALYRKNGEGSWDQVSDCESPRVTNMSADHLGFCAGFIAVVNAVAAVDAGAQS